MKRSEFIKAVRSAKRVMANVRTTQHDCDYIQVVKSSLLGRIPTDPDTTFEARLSQNGEILWID